MQSDLNMTTTKEGGFNDYNKQRNQLKENNQNGR